MATNPLPKGTVNVSVNMPREVAERLREMARDSGMKRNKYCAQVLQEAIKSGAIVKITTHLVRQKKKPLVSPLSKQRNSAA